MHSGYSDVESERFQVKLFLGFTGLGVHLRQESAQRLEALSASGLIRGITDQQAKIGFQAAIDGVVKGQRQRCRRRDPSRHATLELALLAQHGGSGQEPQEPVTSRQSHYRLSPHLLFPNFPFATTRWSAFMPGSK